MSTTTTLSRLGFAERIDSLRKTKLEQTAEKQRVIGCMDYDDWALVLPPPELRKVVKNMGASGVEIRDCLLSSFTAEPNHACGGFYGPVAVGRNFRRLLDAHPAYVDPMSSLAGAYMTNFFSYRGTHWNPDLDYGFLAAGQKLYKLNHGIGGTQHFCQDFTIGLELGWGGLLEKIGRHRGVNTDASAAAFYDGLEQVVLGMQDWIRRTADLADERAASEPRPDLRDDLLETARINRKLVTEPPATFREACQWVLWHLLAARMYDGSGSAGRLDEALLPFYERDRAAGRLTDDEARFHLACLLFRDTSYHQAGGYGPDGKDNTNRLSFLLLEACDAVRIAANVGVAVGDGIDPRLLRAGVDMIMRNRNGLPKFLGFDQTSKGFARNGYPVSLGHQRVYSGCHWSAIPGREYTLNDIVKINLAVVFDVALRDMMAREPDAAGCALLWTYFRKHVAAACSTTAKGIAFHLEHMGEVFPELVMDLLCHGPVEKGKDAASGGVEYYDLGIDAAALATVADSFAALELRIEGEKALDWRRLMELLDSDWAGPDGESLRLLMRNGPRFGSGGSLSDDWAVRISDLFSREVVALSLPGRYRLIPGIFSWALVYVMGKDVGATPNGRKAGDPISHGANPHPGFRRDGAATAITSAVASVQPGWGNTAPLQLDIDPGTVSGTDGAAILESLITTHFRLGGTQINLNVLDTAQVLEAYQDPSTHPELVVRVTGFSAYFTSLSPEMRKFVVDRIIREGA
jgi:pyruvate-formate lyase